MTLTLKTKSPRPTPEPRADDIRHDWQREEVMALYALPFNDLLYRAHGTFRTWHDPNKVQISTLLSIKTGACPEDCAYCPQSGRYDTDIEPERLLSLDEVEQTAVAAKASGASRFCMGAAWRNPTDKHLDHAVEMIHTVRKTGLETCMTLGMLTQPQARRLKAAGLDYYNHNLDTSPEFYGSIITTRTYQNRLDTLEHVRAAGIHVCCGGIIGMGESREDRTGLLLQLAGMPSHPESVPINMLVQIKGTPLYGIEKLDPFEFVRTIAVARLLMPQAYVRLSAGARSHERADPGTVLFCRRQLRLLRRHPADRQKSRTPQGPATVQPSGHRSRPATRPRAGLSPHIPA